MSCPKPCFVLSEFTALAAALLGTLLMLCPALSRAESYASLDRKIVEAYNASPKEMNNVYIYAMQILEKTRNDHSADSDAWEDKAQQIITIAAYSEVDRALQNNQNREAYLWAMRGLTNGASRGELGSVKIKQIYDLLKDVSERLSDNPEVKEMKYGKTKREILDYHTVRKDSRYPSRDKRDLASQLVEKNPSYEVTEGPTQDSSGHIYVKIRYSFGGMLKIRYRIKKGWSVDPAPVGEPRYYSSWQECAAANAKTGNLPGVPAQPIKNRQEDKKIYYVPAASNAALMQKQSIQEEK